METIDLIGYTVNAMGGDKLTNLLTIVEELIGLDKITSRAISLINPYNQYKFLEETILGIDNAENKLKEFMQSYKIKVPEMYGWKHTEYLDGKERTHENDEWYSDKYACYREMHKSAMQIIQNAIDCLDEVPITITTKKINNITIKAGNFEDVYEMYEM